ncbi:lysylphosphatidylglycerol synthase domain-containing protein [Massilia sp. 9096]|uniref:lysylphosphatidylglycerol synthase domain-containing protein n=1 Tax=Massilia sp. 9096 TaxID=1500894 RepID=UPI000563ADF1|nr:lysylphosphatidylglycerol synthase domain-containing protein [Massilia sp. 9096]
MKRLTILGVIAGLALLVALVLWQGWRDVLRVFEHAGWPLLLLVPARIVTLAMDTWAWRILLEPLLQPRPASTPSTPARAGLGFLLWVALVREAVNRLLPAAGIGGEVAGVRLARTRIPDTAGVTASVIVEVLLTIGVLYLFCGLGVVLMARIAGGADQVWVIAASLLLSLPLPALAWWLLRGGQAFQRLERFALRAFGEKTLAALSIDGSMQGAALDSAIGTLMKQRARLLRALAWQLLSYLLGSFETWYALRLLGHPVDAGTAVAIEALSQAVRHAGFMVPAGLGVQEAAVLLFGMLAGVGGEVALSLALVKRMREIVLGIPALLSWQWFEARAWRRERAASAQRV